MTYELALDILPLDLYAQIQVCMSVRGPESGNTQTDTQDTQTDGVKTITSDTSQK